MPKGELRAVTPDSDFIRYLETEGPAAYAKHFDLDISSVYRRRKNLERKYGRQISVKATGNAPARSPSEAKSSRSKVRKKKPRRVRQFDDEDEYDPETGQPLDDDVAPKS